MRKKALRVSLTQAGAVDGTTLRPSRRLDALERGFVAFTAIERDVGDPALAEGHDTAVPSGEFIFATLSGTVALTAERM